MNTFRKIHQKNTKVKKTFYIERFHGSDWLDYDVIKYAVALVSRATDVLT